MAASHPPSPDRRSTRRDAPAGDHSRSVTQTVSLRKLLTDHSILAGHRSHISGQSQTNSLRYKPKVARLIACGCSLIQPMQRG